MRPQLQLADATATQNEVDFLPLRVTSVTAAGKRKFDAEGKRKLIEACLQPGASIAGLALKAGGTRTNCISGFNCANARMPLLRR
ncbi:hypothetical protein [Trinickia acidisoli]|uniref:hypothetical protein n=1 Tax=Trinickia acidisoli TaxID=2767482 RepID=UPI002852E63F|nr:hypothetical protein [Trinickia acidisoli]